MALVASDIDILVQQGEGTTLEFKGRGFRTSVADLLHCIGFIEKAGTGIRRIRDGAKAVDCPEPAFSAICGHFAEPRV